MKKRALSLMMALVMVFSLLPVNVLATDTATESDLPETRITTTVEDSGDTTQVGDVEPTIEPTVEPTVAPTVEPTAVPTEEPAATSAPEVTPEVTPEATPEVTPEPTPEVTPEPASEEAPVYEAAPELEGCILAEGHEGECYVCEEGCILSGEAEHEENGWECLVWTACTLTEGCELGDGHEGECTGASVFADEKLPIHFFLASPGNINNPNGSYTNYNLDSTPNNLESYVLNIKSENRWNEIRTENGIRNVYDESIITYYVKSWPDGKDAETFKDFGSVTIDGVTYSDTEYEIKWVSIMYRDNNAAGAGRYCSQYSSARYEHIHIDGLLVEKVQIEPGTMEIFKSIPEVLNTDTTFTFKLEKLTQSSLTAKPDGTVDTSFEPLTLTATIPAGQTTASITGAGDITFGYYKLTEVATSGWANDGVSFDPTSEDPFTSTANAVYVQIAPDGTVQYCDTPGGTYRTMDKVTVQNKRAAVSVTYEWRLYDGSGNYIAMPEGITPPLPATETNVQYGSNYVYNTSYDNGDSFVNPTTGEMYTFRGWDTYSHSSIFNVTPSTGYIKLDDDDQDASNNDTIPMTADTYIYGYWEKTQLDPITAHIAVEKKFVLDGQEISDLTGTPIASAAGLWFQVDPGIDMDKDGVQRVDIAYSAILAQNGEYKLPVYQYDTDFKFTEHDADVPGYTRTTKIEVTGDNAFLTTSNGDYAEVDLTAVYDQNEENVRLGTITYTNSYTKNKATTGINEYPTLVLGKIGTDGGKQTDAEFILYTSTDGGATVGQQIGQTIVIPESGIVEIGFDDMAEATYYLKETKAPAGYHLDPSVYTIQLVKGETEEELRGNEYVDVTYYTLTVTKPEDSAADIVAAHTGNTYNLTVYDEPILGEVTFTKVAKVGDTEVDKATVLPNLNANVVVHGPITRDANDNVIDLGEIYDLYLHKDNENPEPVDPENPNDYQATTPWTVTLSNLPLGEYWVREPFASVHGYTWNESAVLYNGAAPTEEYNDVLHYSFHVTDTANDVNIELTNTYAEWEAADFFIYKVDGNNTANFLEGAEFTLYDNAECKGEGVTKVTGPAGFAHFTGFTVPEGQTSVTYYLKETKAPAGYYLDETVYKVEIKPVTENGKTSFKTKISVLVNNEWDEADFTNSEADFDPNTDEFIVKNYPVLGQITIQKENLGNPEGLASIQVNVIGPNGYYVKETLNATNEWEVTLEDLSLGEYTITEVDAAVPGYDLKTTYDVNGTAENKVVLAETEAGETVDVTGQYEVTGAIKITNTYTRNDEYFSNPTNLTVLKTDEKGNVLPGAVFMLSRNSDGKSMTFTTGTDGKVVFENLVGTVTDNGKTLGEDKGKAVYTLTEVSAPEGYVASGESWEIIVEEDDGKLRVVLDEKDNVFENFWDWITGSDPEKKYIWENGALTVTNHKVTGELTVSKEQTGVEAAYVEAVTVYVTGPNNYSKEIVLKDNEGTENDWTATLTGLELGDYSVTEATITPETGYEYTVTMSESGELVTGSINNDGEVLLSIDKRGDNYVVSARVDITNHYDKIEGDNHDVWPGFKVYKTDAQSKALAGATFELAGANLSENRVLTSDANGNIDFGELPGVGEYTLTELTAPDGYAKDATRYEVFVSVRDGFPEERLYNSHFVQWYEYDITVKKNGEVVTGAFANNTLTVVNPKVTGELIITKSIPTTSAYTPTEVDVVVTKLNGTLVGEYVLSAKTGWTTTIENLELGTYVVREADANVDGYKLTTTYTDIDGNVTYGDANDGRITLAVGDLAADSTTAVVSSTVQITNTYTKNAVVPAYDYPELTVYKMRTGTTDVMLDGAKFVLTQTAYTGTSDGDSWVYQLNVPVVKTTADGGKIIFENLEPGTYTLVETVAPDGYGITENTYTIEVKQIDETGEILQADGTWLNTYTYDITSVTDTNTAVDIRFVESTNTLAVFNSVDEGSITITKDFGVDSLLDVDPESNEFAGKKFTFKITDKDGNAVKDMNGNVVAPVTLPTADGGWTVTVAHLPLGKYKVVEVTDGSDNQHVIKDNMYEYNGEAYTWTVAYDPNGGNVDITADDADDTVAVTNTFSKITPGRLDVKKIDSVSKKALEGAQFALYKADENFKKASDTALVTYTTTADGIASFSGFLKNGYYVLEEVSAPANYNKGAKSSWNIEVVRYKNVDDTEAVKFIIDGAKKTNSVTLEVENSRKTGNLVINKTVSYDGLTMEQIKQMHIDLYQTKNPNSELTGEELLEAALPASYRFLVTILDDNNQPAVIDGTTYNAYEVAVPVNYADTGINGSLTIENVPYGYIYSVQEVTTGAVFTSVVGNGSGKIGAAETKVNATNTYTIVTETPGLQIVKHDSSASHKVIEGAEFELTSPSGAVVTGTTDKDGKLNLAMTEVGTYKLEETEPANGYHANDTVYTIETEYKYEDDVANNIVKQIVVLKSVSGAGETDENATIQHIVGNEIHVLNTAIKPVVISVEKVWDDDNYYARPEQINVYLYMDDKINEEVSWRIYDVIPVALSEKNNWRYVWDGGIEAGLTDEYNWKVEEIAPEGYAATYTNDGNHWVITNTRNPGDIELTVKKEWVDNNDTSYKPTSIKVQLMCIDDPEHPVAYGKPEELKGESWSYTWKTATHPAVNDAHKWTVMELVPDGYTAEVTTTVDGVDYLVDDGTLTITNTRIIRDLELTVNKAWANIPEGYVKPEIVVELYKDKVLVEGESKTLTEANGWTATWTGLTDDAVWEVAERVDTNLFDPTWAQPVFGTKVGEDGKTVVTQNVVITNTLKYTEQDFSVIKQWNVPDGYTNIPASVEMQLYRDGKAYGDPVKLSKDNGWTYKWEDLPDCFDWTVAEINVPAGYEAYGPITEDGWTNYIVNTLDYDLEYVNVYKLWLNPTGYTKQPTSVTAVLYRDGVAYDSVVLSKENNWTYKWEDLPDCFKWTVDEPTVPSDYSKKITHLGNNWVITNAHKDIPLTGDDSNIALWAGVIGVAVVGLTASLILLLKKRKEEDEQEEQA